MLALPAAPPVFCRPCELLGPPCSRVAGVSPFKRRGVSPPLPKASPAPAILGTLPPPESALEEISRLSRLRLRWMIESGNLDDAETLHGRMRSQGIKIGVVLESVLINALMRAGRTLEAFRLFEGMPERNVVVWTSMILGCIRNGNPGRGFTLFVEMVASEVLPNDFSLNVALQACASMAAIDYGRQVHSLIIRSGFEGDSRTGVCLINFYSSCCSMSEAVLVFNRMQEQGVVSYTSLIAGFCKNYMFGSAVGVFLDMLNCGIHPNEHTMSTLLAASSTLQLGAQIHGYIVKAGIEKNLHCSCALIELYSRHDALKQAQLVFSKLDTKSVVTWSSMISCCIQNGQPSDALRLFCQMLCSDTAPNEFTLATVISGCGLCTELLGMGRQTHCLTLKLGMQTDDRVCNALITMYARNGEMDKSEVLFTRCQEPDAVTWSAVVSGYFQNGQNEKAISTLCKMHRKGYEPNEFGLSSAASSCANLALLDQGRQLHSFAVKLGCDLHACMRNAFVNMYAKCGCIKDARLAFDCMPAHDVLSWNSLIHGYAQSGRGLAALELFDQMVDAGKVVPNDSTFLAVLVACSHTGHVDRALEYLKCMANSHGVLPSLSHYACVVDMMGRAGRLLDAVQVIDKMPFEPDCLVWKSLLGSCRLHGNFELGNLAARKVLELCPEDSAGYVLLSSLYAMRGEWNHAKGVRQMMEDRGVKKDAAWSWIEMNSVVHAFVSADKSHPRTGDIYRSLEDLMKQMKDEGYSPDLTAIAYEV